MEERYLIDTSAVIKYLNATLPFAGLELLDSIVDNETIISLITEIELRVWEPSNGDDKEIYHRFISGSLIVNLDREIVEQTILIRKKFRLKLPDAFIAATAIVNDFTLIADNDKDFARVENLKYLNPSNKN